MAVGNFLRKSEQGNSIDKKFIENKIMIIHYCLFIFFKKPIIRIKNCTSIYMAAKEKPQMYNITF